MNYISQKGKNTLTEYCFGVIYISESTKKLKSRAKNILFASYIKFLFATVFSVSLCFGFFILASSYAGLFFSLASEETAYFVTLTAELCSALLCLPLVFGYVCFVIRTIRGEDCSLSELFSPYASPRLLKKCYTFILCNIPAILFKVVLPCFAVIYMHYAINEYAEFFNGTPFAAFISIVRTLYFIPAILILLFGFYLFGKNIYSFFSICEEIVQQSSLKCDYNSDTERNTKKSERHGLTASFLKLRLSSLLVVALSFLSFGVLFLLYTIPHLVIVYCLFFGLDECMLPAEKETTDNITLTSENKTDNTNVFDVQRINENHGKEIY